jgi:predicted DNA-binding protein (UPF0251 family)
MSPRPRKTRTLTAPCHGCSGTIFKPAGIPATDLEQIRILHDELEALFLCDVKELNQQHAGDAMGISRGTVQRLLSSGRRKLAEAVIGRKAIIVTNSPTQNHEELDSVHPETPDETRLVSNKGIACED